MSRRQASYFGCGPCLQADDGSEDQARSADSPSPRLRPGNSPRSGDAARLLALSPRQPLSARPKESGIFQSILHSFRSVKMPEPREAMEGIVQFLEMPYLGPRVTIQNLINLAAPALGGSAYYYAVPYSPGSGDKVEIHNTGGDEMIIAASMRKSETINLRASNLKLVACSDEENGSMAPLDEFVDVINAALSNTVSASVHGRFAAAPVYTMDEIAGVFLVVAPKGIGHDLALNTNSACRAYTKVLNGRLERVRQLALLNEHERKAELYAVGAKVAQQTRIQGVIDLTRGSMREVLNVEIATLWLIDEAHDEMWTPPKPELPRGLCVPVSEGLVGHVATNAKQTRDFHKSLLCTNDPKLCPAWKGEPSGSKITTHCLLTVPILASGKLVGLLQLINKKSMTDLEDSMGFSESDVRLAEVAASILADNLVRLTVDQISTKASMDEVNQHGSSLSFFSEYYQVDSLKDESEKKRGSLKGKRATLNDLSLEELPCVDLDHLLSSDAGKLDVDDWVLDYWTIVKSDAEACKLVLQALARSQVPLPDQEVVFRFYKKVKGGYRDNPYHNLTHAVATVHYAYKLMTTSGMGGHLQTFDQMAVIFGALCHDLDHRGYNSAFEIMTRSDLALRYNDSSPLENHHCARAFEIAFSGGDNGDCNIFKDMSKDFYQPLRKMMVAVILGTDMKFHGDHVKKAQSFDEEQESQDGQFLCELFVHAADIANPFMPPDISERWSACLYDEFTKQVETERRLGLPVTPFMDGLNNPVARAKAGIGFSKFVVFPMVDPLFKILDGWGEPKSWLQDNRQILEDIIASASNGS